MSTSSHSAARYSTAWRDLRWSQEEKAIARKAVDLLSRGNWTQSFGRPGTGHKPAKAGRTVS